MHSFHSPCNKALSSLHPTTIVQMTKEAATTLNPKTTKYSFFGPVGTGAITLLTPLITYALYFACPNSYDDGTCQLLQKPALERLAQCDFWKSLFDLEVFGVYLAWYLFTVVAWAIIPAQWVRGTQLRDGTFKYYKMNGEVVSIQIRHTDLLKSILYTPHGHRSRRWSDRARWSSRLHVLG